MTTKRGILCTWYVHTWRATGVVVEKDPRSVHRRAAREERTEGGMTTEAWPTNASNGSGGSNSNCSKPCASRWCIHSYIHTFISLLPQGPRLVNVYILRTWHACVRGTTQWALAAQRAKKTGGSKLLTEKAKGSGFDCLIDCFGGSGGW